MARIRVISWNLNCGVFVGEPAGARASEEGATYAARCIRCLEPDIVALQEVLFPEQDLPSHAFTIAKEAGFHHVVDFRLSSSHLVPGAGLGLAILSKFPLSEPVDIKLPNPNIMLQQEDGAIIRSHDKGLLGVRVALPDGEILFVCGHFLPFRRFEREPDESPFSKIWTFAEGKLLESSGLPLVGGIDFNTDKISLLMPSTFASGYLQALVHQPTRPTGQQHDQIVCSKQWSDAAVRVLDSRFDHYLCFADLSLAESPEVVASALPKRPSGDRTLILHLSDLHFGEGMADDVDWKTPVEFATRETRRDRFEQFIRALPRVPDYVVISGDLTIAGRESGYASFVKTMDELIVGGFLPKMERFVVVPGNHDVLRLGTSSVDEKERWKRFIEHIGGRFVHPWIPSYAPDSDRIMEVLEEVTDPSSDLWGGTYSGGRFGAAPALSLPFLWDRARGVLFYAFNSASISGSRISVPASTEEAMRVLRNWKGINRDKIYEVLHALDRELRVDPARIDPQELMLFTSIMYFLSQKDPGLLAVSLKIAVLHHHVTPVIPEEVTKFELLLNAGRFKRELKEENFRLILHGHKHWPEVLWDTFVPGEEPQCVISGGTVGGGQASGKRPGFYLLEYHAAEQSLTVKYVILEGTGSPRKSILQGQETIIQFAQKDKDNSRETRPAAMPLLPLRMPALLKSTEDALMDCLRHQIGAPGAEWYGWSHVLDENRVSMIASAYGLSILALTRASLSPCPKNVQMVLRSLLALRREDSGWSASSQSGTRSLPEPTAFALYALHSWSLWDEVQAGKKILENLIDPGNDPVLWQYIYSMATIGRILSEIDPDSEYLLRLSTALSSAAFKDGNGRIHYWSRQALVHADGDFGKIDTLGSVVHTAHATYTLCRAYKATGGRAGVAPEELWGACDWLLLQPEWSNTTEDINRLLAPGKYDKLAVKHFVVPWVIMALLEVGYSADHPRIRSAVGELIQSQQNGLWNWGVLQRPIWATHDALRALLAYALVASKV